MRLLVLLLIPLALLHTVAAANRHQQYRQAFSLLQYERAFCRRFLHGALPPQSTVIESASTTFTPATQTQTSSVTATFVTTSTKTRKFFELSVVTQSTSATVTSISTSLTTTTTTTTTQVTATLPAAVARRRELDMIARGAPPSIAGKVAAYPNSLVTQVCYQILYGATTRPDATSTAVSTATAATPSTTVSVTTKTTSTVSTTVSSTKTRLSTKVITATVSDVESTTRTITTTSTSIQPVATVYTGNGCNECPRGCMCDTALSGQQFCNSDVPLAGASCSSDADCGGTGFCSAFRQRNSAKAGTCISFTKLCTTTPASRRRAFAGSNHKARNSPHLALRA